jgi:PAS domain S-box-containing protein
VVTLASFTDFAVGTGVAGLLAVCFQFILKLRSGSQSANAKLIEGLTGRIDDLEDKLSLKEKAEDHCQQELRSLRDEFAEFRRSEMVPNLADLVCDDTGTIIQANAAATTLFRRNDLIGSKIATLVPSAYMAAHKRGFAAFVNGSRRRAPREPLSVRALRGDGTEVPVEITLRGSFKDTVTGRWTMAASIRERHESFGPPLE